MNPFREVKNIMCGSQTLGQEVVMLKLPWRPKDIQEARAVRFLLRESANNEWKHGGRKKFVAVNKGEKWS